jgi:methylmalonyl-CoA carboxyltransferase 1.3S subunit
LKLRITIAGKTYEADVEVLDEEETATRYASAPMPIPGYVSPPNHAAFTDANSSGDPAEKICRSPVAGLVIRVEVETGQAVEANQLLMVLEAMKMETRITAPRAGIVQKIHVAPGNSVKPNQLLIELDGETAAAEGEV